MPRPVLINLGCGGVWHDAWVNYDLDPQSPIIHPLDLERPLPIASGSADAVYHAHVLEHLDREAGARLLAECARVLKPGSILRVVVPDLEDLARQYLAALERGDPLGHEWATLELFDQMVRTKSEGMMGEFLRAQPWKDHPAIVTRISTEVGAARSCTDVAAPTRYRRPARLLARIRFAVARLILNRRERAVLRHAQFLASGENHRWMYDRASLGRALVDAGFTGPRVRDACESDIAGFAAYRLDTDENGKQRHPDSLYMEARTPA